MTNVCGCENCIVEEIQKISTLKARTKTRVLNLADKTTFKLGKGPLKITRYGITLCHTSYANYGFPDVKLVILKYSRTRL
jgi:hypothetical protein